jgi:hypothetical protein
MSMEEDYDDDSREWIISMYQRNREAGKGLFPLNANTLIVTHVQYVRPEANEGGQTRRRSYSGQYQTYGTELVGVR